MLSAALALWAVLSAEAPLVVVTAASAQDRAATLLVAELKREGFRVSRAASAVSRDDLMARARLAGAAASIRLVPGDAVLEVWVADAVTGRLAVREVSLEGVDSKSADTVAIGAMELLRASLLELSSKTAARPDAPAPADEALPRPARAPPPGEPGLDVRLGVGALFSGGGPQPSGALDARVDLRLLGLLGGSLGVRAQAVVTLGEARVGTPGAGVGLSSVVPALLATWAFPVTAWLSVDASLGVAGLVGFARGATLGQGSGVLGALAPAVGVGATAWVAEGVGLQVGLATFFAVPALAIGFGETQLGTYGLPLVGLTAGVHLRR